ncbi:MAG: ZIP family metal transporter [Epulopiscium sp.]|nr:ZIP family metal transporter [Candidatus Epulonipiscium sp.]
MKYGLLLAVLIGYTSGALGTLIGVGCSSLLYGRGERVQGVLMGFTGGLMLAIVCFDLLPEAFMRGGLYIGLIGILFGILFTFCLEIFFTKYTTDIRSRSSKRYLKTGLLLAVGVALHNIPEGMAVGSLLFISFYSGIRLAGMIMLHAIPEGMAVSIALKQGGVSFPILLIYSFFMGIPMALGSLIGFFVSEISSSFLPLCLGFAGGVMLYVTCGEILPESKELWAGKLSTAGALIGIILGILFTCQ